MEVLLPDPPNTVRLELSDCVLVHQKGMSFPPAGGAFRLRFDEDVDGRIDTVRQWFRGQGREQFVWWVGTSATPHDLEARLRTRGAVPYEEDAVIVTMVATEQPPEVEDVEVRRVERFDDFVLAREIAWGAAGFDEQQEREFRATLPQRWEARRRADDAAVYVAYVDGEPVAAGEAVFLPFAGFLSGASTLPGHRGRGAFRALVRARWDEAARRGTPALIVGAGKMSRPILERIGFSAVAEQHLLLDRSGLST